MVIKLVTKISALSSGKIEKYEYLTGEKCYSLIIKNDRTSSFCIFSSQ